MKIVSTNTTRETAGSPSKTKNAARKPGRIEIETHSAESNAPRLTLTRRTFTTTLIAMQRWVVRAVVAGIGSASIIFGGIFLLLGHTSLGGLVIVVGLVSVFIAFRPKT